MDTKKSNSKASVEKKSTIIKIAETIGQVAGEISVKKDQVALMASIAIDTLKSKIKAIATPKKTVVKKSVTTTKSAAKKKSIPPVGKKNEKKSAPATVTKAYKKATVKAGELTTRKKKSAKPAKKLAPKKEKTGKVVKRTLK